MSTDKRRAEVRKIAQEVDQFHRELTHLTEHAAKNNALAKQHIRTARTHIQLAAEQLDLAIGQMHNASRRK